MVTVNVKDIVSTIQELSYVKVKINQGVEIRKALVERKLRLFEEWDSLPRQERLAQLGRFLNSYKILFERERRIIRLFKDGLDEATRLLAGLETCAGAFSSDMEKTTKLCSEMRWALSSYEKRLKKEEEMLYETKNERKQAMLIGRLYKTFREEVGADLQFAARLKLSVGEIAELQESVHEKLERNKVVRRVLGQVTPKAFPLALYKWVPVALEAARNPAMLLDGSITRTPQFSEATTGVMLAGLMIGLVATLANALIPSLNEEERKLLGELATSETVKGMRMK